MLQVSCIQSWLFDINIVIVMIIVLWVYIFYYSLLIFTFVMFQLFSEGK